jgi:hypothetical protein
MFKQRLACGVVGALLMTAPLAAPSTASADNSWNIGVSGTESRCVKGDYRVCLYYGESIRNAYWPANANTSGLSNHEFWQGTGTGENTIVRNNAGDMFCHRALECDSYYGDSYTGNFDFEFTDQVGHLSYSRGHSSSVKVIITF